MIKVTGCRLDIEYDYESYGAPISSDVVCEAVATFDTPEQAKAFAEKLQHYEGHEIIDCNGDCNIDVPHNPN